MVSIGPYHHGKERLHRMEENKLLHLHSFLSRNPDHRLEDYLEEIEKSEDEARSCYSEKVGPLMGNEFVKMMVLDACFIVEFFLRFLPLMYKLELCKQLCEELKQNEEDLGLISAMDQFFFRSNCFEDPIRHVNWMELLIIGYDMLLLENQIPFFVLQLIFKMACPVNVPHLLEKMALYFFDEFMPRNKKIEIKDSCPYYHLLHLFHSHLLPTPTNYSKEEPNLSCTPKIKLKPNLFCNPKIKSVLNKLKNLLIIFLPSSNEATLPITEQREMIPRATYLEFAGVKFKKIKKSNNILNVKFSHGVMEIMPFKIHDHGDTLFRNLVAFEQCCLEAEIHFFTTYLLFMDFLANTSEDVALLQRNGIIDNFLGSDDDVALLFNRLCIGVVHSFWGSYLSDVKDNVQKHCENKWNMWRANLKRTYFTKPSSVISFMAASFVILLTIIQTFFAIFPRSPSY